MHRVIGERSLGETNFSGPDACEMYANLVRARRFDERVRGRQRRGWLGGYASFRGREAVQVGTAFAARPADVTVPTRRSDALQLARDVPPAALLRTYRGGGRDADVDAAVFPRTGTTGAGLPIAVGAAMARDYADEAGVALAFLSAATANEGDFHEACNFAGVFDAPCVFVCESDGGDGAEAVRRTPAPTVAERASAYGFEGVRVDGTDVLAVADAVGRALEDAREGGPVLVEAVVEGAVAADEGAGGGDESVDDGAADPLARFEDFLAAAGVVDDAFAAETREAAEAELDRAVAAVESVDGGDPEAAFEHVYADVPPELRAQRAATRESVDGEWPN
jgi:pyruvate dehydrogenase E1 component alpha subunit